MSFETQFLDKLNEFDSSPFLFVGSGFSRRYLGSETWEGLLRRYTSEMGKSFEQYRSRANSVWPAVGSLIAEDYHTYWFGNQKLQDDHIAFLAQMTNVASPLKVSIAEYLNSLNTSSLSGLLSEEFELLKNAKIGGVITTNYDLLCEDAFPSFKVYKSQQDIIFSHIQEIGEIYKIHGCCSEPNTIVITAEDYNQFNERNSYLAAKLLAVFLEHPTIFIGYSISDPNVRSILQSMIQCLNQGQIEQLASRIFFVQYQHDHVGEPTLERYELEIGGTILPLTRIKCKEFKGVFDVLTRLTQKFPASLLRKIKDHIYELVHTNDPTERISVIDFDSDTELDKVDVVIGVGVKAKHEKSYEIYSKIDVAEDILNDDKDFDISELLAKTLPSLFRFTTWIPVCKYLANVKDTSKLDAKILAARNRPFRDWQASNPYDYLLRQKPPVSFVLEEIIKNNQPAKAVQMLLLIENDKIDIGILETFLNKNFDLIKTKYATSYYMKALCLFDRLKYGNSVPKTTNKIK